LAVLPMVLDRRRIGHEVVGELASWFALGLAVFAVPSGVLIRKFSARAVLTVSIFGYAAMIGILPWVRSYPALALDRFVDGLFSMGVWMSAETLLLWRSNRENKALATSLSATVTMFGYMAGPALSFAVSGMLAPEPRFLLAAGIAGVAGVVCWMGLDPDPPEHHRYTEAHGAGAAGGGAGRGPAGGNAGAGVAPKAGWREILSLVGRIKVSCVATFSSGFFQASAALFVPRFLVREKGVPEEQASLVVAFAAAGMLLVANFAARAGDRFGHALVMRILALVGALGMLAFLPLNSFPLMAAVFVVAGGCLSSMPPLSLALQGVIVDPAEYPRSNSIFNLFFALGLVLGPLITGRVFGAWGGNAIVLLFSGIWLAFVLFGLLFRVEDPRRQP
jgi:MFS family permease